MGGERERASERARERERASEREREGMLVAAPRMRDQYLIQKWEQRESRTGRMTSWRSALPMFLGPRCVAPQRERERARERKTYTQIEKERERWCAREPERV